MNKKEAINYFKSRNKSINEVISDKKLIYFIEKMTSKAEKQHRKNGLVRPTTMFAYKKEGSENLFIAFHSESGNKQQYFDEVSFLEKTLSPVFLISVAEGFSLTGNYDFEQVAKEYGRIGNHPEAIDVFAVHVKTNEGKVYSGEGLVEGKKIFPLIWSEQELLGNCNFTSFSTNN